MLRINQLLSNLLPPPPGRAGYRQPANGAIRLSPVQNTRLSGLGRLAFCALWLLIFAIPWEDAITIPGFGTSLRLIGMIAVSLGLLVVLENGGMRRPAPGHLMMALFVMLAAGSYLWSLYPEGTLTQSFTYIQLLVMVWLIWELAARTHEQTRLMQAYVFGTFVSGIDTLTRFLSHQEADYQRYAGAGLNANDLGLIMALSIPLSYYLMIQGRGKMVWVYRLQLVMAGTTVLLTASRGATLACVVALAIVPLTHARLSGRQKVAAFITLVLLISAAIAYTPPTSWERLSTTPNELRRGTLTGRTIVWNAGWELFSAHPFVGVGSNAFRLIVSRVLAEPIRPDDPHSPAPPAHNTFLSVLVEMGVLGFVVFCALLVVLAVSLKDMPAFPRKLWIVCLAVWAVGVSGLTWEMRKPTWFFFGLLVAQSASLVQARQSRRVPVRLEFVSEPPAYRGDTRSFLAPQAESQI